MSDNTAPEISPEGELTPKGKLSNFMVANIWMLSLMGVASAFVLLLGNFEGKFVRVFATLLLFVIFTVLTAKDTSSKKPFLAVPIALGGNVYMLGLSLMLIWATLLKYGYDGSFIIPKMLFLILIIKVAILVIQKISYLIFTDETQLSLGAKLAAGALALTTILYTLPVGLDQIFTFGDFYWKFAVFITILAGLALSVTALIFWAFKDRLPEGLVGEFIRPKPVYNLNDDRNVPAPPVPTSSLGEPICFKPANPPARPEAGPAFSNPINAPEAPKYGEPPQQKIQQPSAPVQPPAPPILPPAPAVQAPANHAPQVSAPGLPVYAPPPVSPLKWPVFPDGSPIPANASGRPDFKALGAMSLRLIELEKQWSPRGGQE